MPPVVHKGDRQITDEDTPPKSKRFGGPQSQWLKKRIPPTGPDKGHHDLATVEQQGTGPPTGDPRPGSSRTKSLDTHHDDGDGADGHGNPHGNLQSKQWVTVSGANQRCGDGEGTELAVAEPGRNLGLTGIVPEDVKLLRIRWLQ